MLNKNRVSWQGLQRTLPTENLDDPRLILDTFLSSLNLAEFYGGHLV